MILTLYSLQIEPLSLFMNSFLLPKIQLIRTFPLPQILLPIDFLTLSPAVAPMTKKRNIIIQNYLFNATLFCSQVSCNLIINHSTGSFFLFPFFVPSIQSNVPDHQYRIGWHLLSPFVDLFDALPSFRLRIKSIFFSAVRAAKKGWHNGP